MQAITFFVKGTALTQGSKSAFIVGRRKLVVNGQSYLVGGRPVMADYRQRDLRKWRKSVDTAAKIVLGARSGKWNNGEAAVLVLEFLFQRPQWHSASVARAPRKHQQRPDVDKLMRAVMDALTPTLWEDDCQVYDARATKRYCEEGEEPGVRVSVTTE